MELIVQHLVPLNLSMTKYAFLLYAFILENSKLRNQIINFISSEGEVGKYILINSSYLALKNNCIFKEEGLLYESPINHL